MCGLGKLSMADNSVYEGEFVDSKFHGKGSLTWPDGSRYDGHYGSKFLFFSLIEMIKACSLIKF